MIIIREVNMDNDGGVQACGQPSGWCRRGSRRRWWRSSSPPALTPWPRRAASMPHSATWSQTTGGQHWLFYVFLRGVHFYMKTKARAPAVPVPVLVNPTSLIQFCYLLSTVLAGIRLVFERYSCALRYFFYRSCNDHRTIKSFSFFVNLRKGEVKCVYQMLFL